MTAKKSTQIRKDKKRVESLLTYLKSISSENDLEKFAQDCETTTGNLMQIAYGGSVSAKLSKKIYEKSEKKVFLAELRPDIFS
jgi:hypothetical protein